VFTRETFGAWFRLENPGEKPAEIALSRWSFIRMTYENIRESDAPINSSHNYESLEMREKRSVRQARVQDFSRTSESAIASTSGRPSGVRLALSQPFRGALQPMLRTSHRAVRWRLFDVYLSGISRQSDVTRQCDAVCRYDTRFIFGIFR